jgi:hypothetical protein
MLHKLFANGGLPTLCKSVIVECLDVPTTLKLDVGWKP